MQKEFRLPPPPRNVPLPLAIVMVTGSKIAWGVLAFASIFFWLFCARADLSFLTFQPPFEEAQGTVTSVRDAGAREDRQNLYAIEYSYHVQGAALSGTSYALGSVPELGERVTVEYRAGNPLRSRIAGMRRDLWSPWILMLAAFPGVCLIAVIVTMRNGMRRRHLLRDGMLTTGRLAEKRKTNVTVNKRVVYELIFEFEAYDGRQFTTSSKTNQPDRLEDQAEEPLIYDPLDPSRAYLLDSLPSRPQLDEVGNLRDPGAGAAVFALLVPIVAIALNLFLLSRRV
ncbi:MAG TPA: DUF3592 domain-containing protein [Thermoanaerobaculia bacterium]